MNFGNFRLDANSRHISLANNKFNPASYAFNTQKPIPGKFQSSYLDDYYQFQKLRFLQKTGFKFYELISKHCINQSTTTIETLSKICCF